MSTVSLNLPKNAAELLRRLGDIPPELIRIVPPPGTATERDRCESCELQDGTLILKAPPREHSDPPQTLADLARLLGDIPLERIQLVPPIGQATEEDLLEHHEGDCPSELIYGTIVEKGVGAPESCIAVNLLGFLVPYVRRNKIGYSMGSDGITEFLGVIRYPDISVVRWERTPDGKPPKDAISKVIPNITAEVISRGNTRREIEEKRELYFDAGVEIVWVIHPPTQTIEVWVSKTEYKTLGIHDSLDGGNVIPGFSVEIREIFE